MTSRRKWTRRILFAVLVIAVTYVAARLVGGAISSARLEAELEKARATGAPLTLADAFPATVPDALNAAALLEQAFLLLPDDSEEPYVHWEELQEDARAMPEDAAQLFRAWVEKNETALARVEEAVRLPHCLFDRDIEKGWGYDVDHVPGIQSASRALSARGYLQIRDGDVDAALATSASLIRLGRRVRDFPSLIDVLVGMGVEDVGSLVSRQALSSGAPSQAAVLSLLEVVAALPSEETLVPVFTFERALGIWSFERVVDVVEGGDEQRGVGGDATHALGEDRPDIVDPVVDRAADLVLDRVARHLEL